MSVVIGAFSSRDAAATAIDQLEEHGYQPDQIGLMWRDAEQAEAVTETTYEDSFDSPGEEATKGAVGGALGGGATGLGTAMLATGFAVIPGIGQVAAAGTLLTTAAATAAGAAGGAATGGLLGALLGATDDTATKSDETVTRYRAVIERNGAVVTVEVDDQGADDTVDQLRQVGADDIERFDDVDG